MEYRKDDNARKVMPWYDKLRPLYEKIDADPHRDDVLNYARHALQPVRAITDSIVQGLPVRPFQESLCDRAIANIEAYMASNKVWRQIKHFFKFTSADQAEQWRQWEGRLFSHLPIYPNYYNVTKLSFDKEFELLPYERHPWHDIWSPKNLATWRRIGDQAEKSENLLVKEDARQIIAHQWYFIIVENLRKLNEMHWNKYINASMKKKLQLYFKKMFRDVLLVIDAVSRGKHLDMTIGKDGIDIETPSKKFEDLLASIKIDGGHRATRRGVRRAVVRKSRRNMIKKKPMLLTR